MARAKAVKNKKGKAKSARAKQIELDFRRMWVARLYLRQLSQDEIVLRLAEAPILLKVDRSTVSRDLTALRKHWQIQTLATFNEAMNHELAKVDHLEGVYWAVFYRSQKPRKRTKRQKKGRPVGKKSTPSSRSAWPMFSKEGQADLEASYAAEDEAGSSSVSAESVMEEEIIQWRDGELQALKGVQWCIDKRCQLLGLNAPDVIELAHGFAGFTGKDAAMAEKELKDWRKNMHPKRRQN